MDTLPIVGVGLIAILSGIVLFFLSSWGVISYVTSRDDLRKASTKTVTPIITVAGIVISLVVYLVTGLIVKLI